MKAFDLGDDEYFAPTSSVSSELSEEHVASPPLPGQSSSAESFYFRTRPKIGYRSLSLTSTCKLGGRINALPLELLTEIFSWYCPSRSSPDPDFALEALALSQVCRHWRIVALSAPRLWTYIKLYVVDRQLSKALDLLRMWLARAGALGVFIDVEFQDRFQYPNRTPIIELFSNLSDVVREINPQPKYDNRLSKPIAHIESGFVSDVPMLEEWYYWSSSPVKPSHLWPTTAPAVKGVQPTSDPFPYAFTEIRASYSSYNPFIIRDHLPIASSLTHLRISDVDDFSCPDIRTVMHILSTFPFLMTFDVYIGRDDGDHFLAHDAADGVTLNTLRVPHLRSFVLSFHDLLDVSPLLDALTAPALTELEMSGFVPESAQPTWPHLKNFLKRSAAATPTSRLPLSHLTLGYFDSFYCELLSCLDIIGASLEELILENCILDSNILWGVLIRSDLLRSLSLMSCFSISLTELASTIQHCNKEPGELQVYVHDCGMPTNAELAAIGQVSSVYLGPSYVQGVSGS